MQYANDTAQLDKIFMIDSSTGWALGPYLVLNTTNSGQYWQPKNIGINGTIDIFFINPNTGWIVGYSYIIKTTNAGLNWSSPNYVSNSLDKTYFVDASTGFLLDYSNCWRTTNGGINWASQYLLNVSFLSIDFVNHDTGWIGGTNGVLFKTSNCGINWIQKTTLTDTRFYGLSFPTSDTGWGVGFNNSGTSRILFTSNGGDNWITQYVNSSILLKDVFFSSNKEGWVAGGPGCILYTSNAGNSWQLQDCGVFNILLQSISFVSPKIGWIAGEIAGANGKIFKTTTGGIVPVNYIKSEIPTKFELHQNYPNPFNSSTTIKFELPKFVYVALKVFDITGREVTTLINNNLNAGIRTSYLDASNLSSGIYYYRLVADNYTETKKMILIK